MQADPLKIAAVQRYLESKFSGCEIGHRQDSDKGLEVFTIEAEPDGRMFTVKVAHAFLDDYKPQEIALKLDQWQVGGKKELVCRGRSKRRRDLIVASPLFNRCNEWRFRP